MSSLNFSAIEQANVTKNPYPYFIVEQSINSDYIDPILKTFPIIDRGGSFTLDSLESGPAFNALVDELNHSQFREIISRKLDMDLSTFPMIVTLRGMSRAKDGRIHTDSKSKIATILIYFNENWSNDNGRLRILNSNDMNDAAGEIAPNAGAMVAFKVTDNCWHGYPSYEGIRRSIQINFVGDEKAVRKHHHRHGWTSKLKSLKRLFSRD